MDTNVNAVLTTVNDNIKKGLYIPSPDVKVEQVATNIAINDIRRTQRKTIAQNIVAPFLLKKFAAKQIDPIFFSTPQSAFTILLVGGPATGKSTLTRDLLSHYSKIYGIKPEDISFISADVFRLPLLNDHDLGNDTAHHGSLTQDEASSLTYNTILRRREMIGQGIASHALFEQMCVNPSELELIGSGTQFRVYATFCCPVRAVTNNHNRFMRTKERLVPNQYVLQGQKLATDRMPSLLNCGEKDIILEIHNTDLKQNQTNTESKSTHPVAILNKSKNRLYVLDLASLLDFVKRSELNPLATCLSTLFPNQQQTSLAACAEKLKKQYGSLEIVFIDPAVQNLDHNNLDEHAYARHSAGDGLRIEQQGVFDQQVAMPAGKAMFNALSSQASQPSKNNSGESASNVLAMR